VSHLRADRRDPAALRAALEGARFDFTADFLAFGGGDVDRLLSVPGFSPGRLVAISSGQVYLVTASPEPPFREEAAERAPMPEPAPGTRDHDEWKYGMGKRAMEAALARATGLEALALRLPVVQGEEDRAGSRRLWAWIERMLDGGPVLLPEGGRQVVRFVYAGSVAEALLALATSRSWPAERALNFAQADELPDVVRVSDPTETRLSMALSGTTGAKRALASAYLRVRRRAGGCVVICGWEGEREAVERRRALAARRLRAGGAASLGGSPGRAWERGRYEGPYLRDELLDLLLNGGGT